MIFKQLHRWSLPVPFLHSFLANGMGVQPESALQVILLLPVHLIIWLYSLLSFLPWYYITGAGRKKDLSNRTKACSITGRPEGPYRCIDHFESLATEDFPGKDTLDKLFNYAVLRFGPEPCLGTRDVLSEENEIQPTGKVFKKVGILFFFFCGILCSTNKMCWLKSVSTALS